MCELAWMPIFLGSATTGVHPWNSDGLFCSNIWGKNVTARNEYQKHQNLLSCIFCKLYAISGCICESKNEIVGITGSAPAHVPSRQDTSFCYHWHRMCGNISFHTSCHHYRRLYMNFPHLNLLKMSLFYYVFAWKRAVFQLLSHTGAHVVLPKPRQNLDRKSTSAFPIGPCDHTSEFYY